MLRLEAAPTLKETKEDKEKADLKKLDGEWKIESWVQFGQQVPMDASWNFKGDKYTLDQGNGNVEEGTIKLDVDKKPPFMDLDISAGNCKGKLQVGIYKVDGDTLTVCFAWPDAKERPTEFESTEKNRAILITLKRPKK